MGPITDINGVNVTKKQEFKALVMKDPGKGENKNTLVAHWVGGSRSRVELKDKVVHLGGPGEFDAMQMLLATLAACDVDLMAIHASLLGLTIESLSVEATGHFNAQSYLGVEGAPPSAYDAISYTVRVSVPDATPEQIAYLHERCVRSSPVRDSLARSIPLEFEFKANAYEGQTMKMQSEVKGEGIPLVLVGGGLTGWKSWEPFVNVFVAKQRKVIRVQLIGVQYGLENRSLPPDYSIKTESTALSETLESLGYREPLDIVAWSYGGFTALIYALDHPDRIRTLTLIEPPAMWVLRETGRFDEEAQQTAGFFQNFQGEITEDMLADFLRRAGFVAPGESPRALPQWKDWVPFRQSLRVNRFVVSYNDSVQRLKEFHPPVLLVKGTGSTAWLHHVIDGLSDSLPRSRVVEFPGGHAPHIVSRDRFFPELERFQKEPVKE